MSFIDISAPPGFECGFQSNLDYKNKKYCFKYEYADRGRRCMIVGDDKDTFIHWFNKLDKNHRKFYELIREDDIVAEYYDIDFKLDNEKSIEELEDMSNEIIKSLLYVRNELSQQKISKKDIVVLSAHTKDKLSLHIISRKTYFQNNRLQRIFAMDIFDYMVEEEFEFNIDTSVYSNNRCFRMYKNHKYGKDNDLVLFQPSQYCRASFEETWVVLTHQDLSYRTEIQKYSVDDLVIKQFEDMNETMTDDLEKLLLDFVEEHPYFKIETNSSKPINRLNRIDHHTRQCLTDPNDQHSTENMFYYIKNNSLFVGCFCGKGSHICLGMRSGVHKIDIEPEKFNYGTHSSDDFKSYDDFGNVKTIYDKRRTGKGKTTSAMTYATKFKKVLLVHHRLSLDDDYIQKYPEYISYQNGTNNDKQTVCFNSLNKIDTNNYDLIIIDEIRSILKQTEMKDMVYSVHTLFNILENDSIPVIMLDANLTNSDIKFLSKYRPDPKKVVIHDDCVKTDKNVFIVPICSELEILSKIDYTIRSDKKVVIVYNRSIESMNALLRQYSEDYRVLHINRFTRKDVDMDSSKWYDEYDIIAYSPTISEGVSINDQRYKQVDAFGLFTSTSCPAECVSQMIARFRAIQNFVIYLDDKRQKAVPKFYKPQDVLEYINNNISRLHSISKTHCNLQRDNGSIKIIEDEFCELFCKNLLEQSLDYHNYRKTLIQKLVNNGYNVYEDLNQELNEEKKKIIEEKVKSLKRQERDRKNQMILDSPTISKTEYTRLCDVGVSNEREDCIIKKYNILQSLNINTCNLTVELIDKFRSGHSKYILKNIKQCFGFLRNEYGDIERIPTTVLIKESASNIIDKYDTYTSFLDQKKSLTHFNTSKLDWLNCRVRDLGFSYLLSHEGIEKSIFDENLTRVLRHYKDSRNYNEYVSGQLLFGKHFNREKHRELGLDFIFGKTQDMLKLSFGVDTKTDRVYQQISLPIKLHDKEHTTPNILGNIVLPDNVVSRYNTMFMKGIQGDYCKVCNKHVKGGIGFRHLNSKNHLKNIEQ
jgi:hypothetical protein